MGSQDMLKDWAKAIETIWSIDLDALKKAIREELTAEVRDEIRTELADEIRAELEDAVRAANESDAPEIGTEEAWGQDDATGLAAFLEVFNNNW